MYNPKPFPVNDTERLVKFAREHNFGHFISSDNGESQVASIPLLIDDEFKRIRGHIALANGIWKEQEGKKVLVLFAGPNHYISPGWYEEDHAVPTWNYVSVIASGTLRIVKETEKKIEILDELTLVHEQRLGRDWWADWSDPEFIGMLKAIVAFEIEVTHVEGKWKLSQNHPKENCYNVIRNLKALGTPESMKIAEMMGSVWA